MRPARPTLAATFILALQTNGQPTTTQPIISIITCKTRIMAPQKRRKTLVKAVLGQVSEIARMKTRHVVIECAKSKHHW